MILYPTETVYALGVGVFDTVEVEKLFTLKRRDDKKAVSWLVRNLADIEKYAELSVVAKEIAQRFLPGPLTIILPAKVTVPRLYTAENKTIGFRISSDPIAQKIITNFIQENDMPLTCTSANVSGLPTLPTPSEILNQFGNDQSLIDIIYDEGARTGTHSTIIQVTGSQINVMVNCLPKCNRRLF